MADMILLYSCVQTYKVSERTVNGSNRIVSGRVIHTVEGIPSGTRDASENPVTNKGSVRTVTRI